VSENPFIAEIARMWPKLRIVLNHMANVPIDGGAPPTAWMNAIALLEPVPNVWCKASSLVEGARRAQTLKDGGASTSLDHYRMVRRSPWRERPMG
jgi:predicted TIM-barrel fold metal-dependent hydrolase